MTAPRIALGPGRARFADDAVTEGGGSIVDLADRPDALVWVDPADMDGLRKAVDGTPSLRWVQLPVAGIERVVEAGILDRDHLWTCAKGTYAEPVAEHALALALAGLRLLPTRVLARSWGDQGGTTLRHAKVAILGGGGITTSLLELLRPLRVDATVVRRRADPLEGARRTVGPDGLHDAIAGSLVVFVALALTPETAGIIGARELDLLGETSWLVNVARGRHVDTAALVATLDAGAIGGAAMDVTDPEPLPDGHPLWGRPNCIITPHSADTLEMVLPLLGDRIRENVRRFSTGEELIGQVDVAAGY